LKPSLSPSKVKGSKRKPGQSCLFFAQRVWSKVPRVPLTPSKPPSPALKAKIQEIFNREGLGGPLNESLKKPWFLIKAIIVFRG